jgi:hypothetical protein
VGSDLIPNEGGTPTGVDTTRSESSSAISRASLFSADRAPAPAPIYREQEDLSDDAVAADPPAGHLSVSATPSRSGSIDAQPIDELRRVIDRRRLEAEERIATVERLEREALAERFTEIDRRSEELASEHQRLFTERLDAAIEAELAQLRQRRQAAEAQMSEQFESRCREESDRLEVWRASERQRIASELAAEEQRFGERLLHQLNEFEIQLGERVREQETKLAGWWVEAQRQTELRIKAANAEVDEA